MGVGKGRAGELTYEQFSLLVQMLEETAAALGDAPLEGDGSDRPAAPAGSDAADDDEEEEAGDLMEGIDEEGVESVARELYADLKGKAKVRLRRAAPAPPAWARHCASLPATPTRCFPYPPPHLTPHTPTPPPPTLHPFLQ